MPGNNGANSFNLGRDISVVIVGPYGRLNVGNVTGFSCAQQTATVRIDRIDSIQLTAELPKGWTGTFEFSRADSAVDDYFATTETAWYVAGQVPIFTIYEYITESNASLSTYQFDNAALKFDDAGNWRGDQDVKGRLSFMSNRRIRV